MNIPAKNGNGAVFQLSAVTLPDDSLSQRIVLVGADGNPIASWPLPSGAATESGLQSILTKLNGTVAVTLASAPLPSGAATDAKLEQVRALLATTLGVSVSNLPATQTVTGSVAVSNFPASPSDYPSVDIGARADAAASSDSGTFSLIALIKRGLASLTSILGRVPVLGQAAKAGSVPVTLASDQGAIPVTGTFWQTTQPVSAAALPLPSNAATASAQGQILSHLQSGSVQVGGAVSVSNLPATQAVSVTSLPLPAGAATETTLAAVRDRLPATPHAQPLTDEQLRTAPVEVTTGCAEDAPATPSTPGFPMLGVRNDSDAPTADDGDWTWLKLDEEGRLKVATKPASITPTVGNLAALNSTVVCDARRASNIVFHLKNVGTVTMAAGTFVFEASLDSTNGTDGTWFGIQAARSNANTAATSVAITSLAVNAGDTYAWEASVNGYRWFRVRCSVAATTNSVARWTLQPGSYATEPLPVNQVSTVTATANIGTYGGIVYTDSSANLAISAAFTGTSRDAGSTVGYGVFAANAFADQAGTLYIDKSTDGTTWRPARQVAVAADTPVELKMLITTRYNRVRFVNSTTAQTAFLLTSTMQRI